MKEESSPSTPIPLQIMRPGEEKESKNRNRELQIVDPNSPIFSRFKLPNNWVVEKRPRINSAVHPSRVDKYYHEPRTGRKFRSLISVQKYLGDEMRDALMPETMKIGNERNMQIVPHTFRNTSSFKLPTDWVIEKKPRSNVNYQGVIDRYYIEPGTGQRFRSLRAVERYLTGMNEDSATLKELKSACQLTKKNHSGKNRSLEIVWKRSTNAKGIKTTPKALEFGNQSVPSRCSGSRKKNKSGGDEKSLMLDFASPPAKVKWVLSGPGGNIWSPSMGESVVPESVKQKWSEMFVISIQDRY